MRLAARFGCLVVAVAMLSGCASTSGPAGGASAHLSVSSSAFSDGAKIPRVHTCQGSNAPPPLTIRGAPSGALSIALVLDDPDAPDGTFTHWTFWDLPPGQTTISSGDASNLGATEGTNSADTVGYVGPCPPSGTHHYLFKAYALGAKLNLPRGASVDAMRQSLQGKILAQGTLTGTYAKT